MSDDDKLQQTRIDLAAAFRLAVRFGLHEGICNHFSCLVPDSEDLILLNPQGLHWSEVTASSLVVINTKGEIVEGDGPIEQTAACIHTRIHEQLPAARCVMHTHMPYATSMTLLEDARLLPLSQTSCMFYRRVAYDDDYNGLAMDMEEGDRIVQCFRDKDILFLASHGVIVTGGSVASAFNDLYYLERACQLQMLAQSTGDECRVLTHDVAKKTAKQFAEEGAEQVPLHFAALKRLLDRSEPDYAE